MHQCNAPTTHHKQNISPESRGMSNSRLPSMFPQLDGTIFDSSNDTSIELMKSWLKPHKHSVGPKEKLLLSPHEGHKDAAGELTLPFATRTDFLLNGINFSIPIRMHYIRTPNRSTLQSFPALPSLIAHNVPTGNHRAPPLYHSCQGFLSQDFVLWEESILTSSR